MILKSVFSLESIFLKKRKTKKKGSLVKFEKHF